MNYEPEWEAKRGDADVLRGHCWLTDWCWQCIQSYSIPLLSVPWVVLCLWGGPHGGSWAKFIWAPTCGCGCEKWFIKTKIGAMPKRQWTQQWLRQQRMGIHNYERESTRHSEKWVRTVHTNWNTRILNCASYMVVLISFMPLGWLCFEINLAMAPQRKW